MSAQITQHVDPEKTIRKLRARVDRLGKALAEQPAHQCKWPTCQSEEYQQALAEQIKRELVGEQPAQRTWQGLTDKEAMQICVDCGCLSEDWLTFLDAIEAKLRSKNT